MERAKRCQKKLKITESVRTVVFRLRERAQASRAGFAVGEAAPALGSK